MPNLAKLFVFGRDNLAHLENPELEAKLLLLTATGLSEEQFYTSPKWIPPLSSRRRFYRLIALRCSGIPIAYLMGRQEFWSLPFLVGEGVLIPRPETELLVEEALKVIGSDKESVVVDVGTGCGNIAISLAKERPEAFILATDISSEAIVWARRNLEFHQISNVHLLQGDGLAPLKNSLPRLGIDLIISNPPYVSQSEWDELSPSIRDYEPRSALLAGEEGLEVMAKLIREAPRLLKPGGILLLEIGWNQKEKVEKLFNSQWAEITFRTDYQGIPRVCRAILKS